MYYLEYVWGVLTSVAVAGVRDYENEWKYFPFIIHLFIRDPCNTVNHSGNNNGFSRSLLSKVVQRCLTDFCCSTAF